MALKALKSEWKWSQWANSAGRLTHTQMTELKVILWCWLMCYTEYGWTGCSGPEVPPSLWKLYGCRDVTKGVGMVGEGRLGAKRGWVTSPAALWGSRSHVRISHQGWLCWRDGPRMWWWSRNLISGARSGVWRGRPSGCTDMSLSLESHSEGSSGSYHIQRSRPARRQTRILRGCLGARNWWTCRRPPLLRRRGREGRPAESRQTETVERENK